MSIPVAIEDLVAATADYGWAYLVTVRDDETPHIVAVSAHWDSAGARIEAGRGTLRNARERPAITLCYPPREPDGYSLIVDGTATVTGDDSLELAPTGAVLHRPASGAGAGSVTGCSNDCAPVPSATG
jgi:Pyridoxamine 5'-phosphate oxidase